MKPRLTHLLTLLLLALAIPSAQAHFPWLATEPDGRVIYFFGETLADQAYEMPPPIAEAEVRATAGSAEGTALALSAVESDAFVGLRSAESAAAGMTLRSQVTYGIYKGSRLDYYTLHRTGPLPEQRKAYQKDPAQKLDAHLIDTEKGVAVFVLSEGQPLASAEVRLFNRDGDEVGTAETDAKGRVSFTDAQVESGLNGIVVGHTVEGESGEVGGESYDSASHYLTATFADPEDFDQNGERKGGPATEVSQSSARAPKAKALRLAAHGSRAVWNDFPGFTADITVSTDSETHSGRIEVDADFAYELSIEEADLQPWVASKLRSVISHRRPSEPRDYDVSLADDDAGHVAGRLVADNGGSGLFRIQDSVIREVHRKSDSAWFEISTLETFPTDDGRYLPKVTSVTFRDLKTGDIESTRSNTYGWRKIGDFYLPDATLTIELGPDGARTTREITLSNHALPTASTAATPSKDTSTMHSPLREPLTSFGAAVLGEYLYVFSGHDGEAHGFGLDALADHFRRIRFDDPEAEWEELAKHDPAQSTALVSDGTHLYRVGGLTFLNRGDEETNFKSTTHFTRYNVEQDAWEELTPLPHPRSSLDAAVVGRSIYVAGGWDLQGESSSDAEWHEDILRYDLDDPEAGWQSLPGPGYTTRAISVAAHEGQLYVIGGIQSRGFTRKVSVFDPADETWSEGPELKPDSRSAGFATSSFATGGDLYVTGASGVLYRLSEDGSDWEIADSLMYPRMFLRLLPVSDSRLIALGGTGSMGGRMAVVESIDVSAEPEAFKTIRWSVPFEGRAKQSQVLVPLGSKLYAFGGNASREPHDFSADAFVDEAFAFDIGRRSVEALPDLPVPLQAGSGTRFAQTSEHEKIILAGGLGMNGDAYGALSEILTYDPEAETWDRASVDLPEPRSMFHSTTQDDALWMFAGAGAGKDSDGLVSSVLHWWGDESDITPLPGVDVPTPRRSFGGATFDGEYYLVGGLTEETGLTDAVDVFHFEDRTWRQAAAPAVPRVFPSLAELNGKLYLFGGFTRDDGHFAPATSLEAYDPEADTWTTVADALDGILPSMRMMEFGGRLLFYGIDPDTDGQANFVLAVPEPTTSPGTFEDRGFSSRGGSSSESTEEAKMLMRRDTDKDGRLTADELGTRLVALLEEGDADDNGLLTYSETKAALEAREAAEEDTEEEASSE